MPDLHGDSCQECKGVMPEVCVFNNDPPPTGDDVAQTEAPTLDAVREQCAAIEHERWAHWQQWMHAQCVPGEDGSLTIPAALVARWGRQIATPYAELSEQEKASDRHQVDRYWPLVSAALEESRRRECSAK